MTIAASATSSDIEIVCRHCSKALLQVSPTSCTVIGQKFWLRDGDEVPGVHDNLAADQSQIAISNILSIGQCWSCFNHHYVVECTFMPDGNMEALYDWMAGCIPEQACPLHYSCREDDAHAPWLLTKHNTKAGKVFEHTLGPFKLDQVSDVTGSIGVSACGTRAHTAPWLHARDLVLQKINTLQKINSLRMVE